MARYSLTDAALDDLDSIYEYGILTFGLEQADRYYDGLVSYFQTVADSPYSHQIINQIRTGYRRAPYYSSSIYYRLDNSEVVIVRILGRQDPTTAC